MNGKINCLFPKIEVKLKLVSCNNFFGLKNLTSTKLHWSNRNPSAVFNKRILEKLIQESTMQPSDSFQQGENKIKLNNKYSNKCKIILVI